MTFLKPEDLKKTPDGKVIVPVDIALETRDRVYRGACSILPGVGITTKDAVKFARQLHREIFGFHDEDLHADRGDAA